jgi:hypothetical protein
MTLISLAALLGLIRICEYSTEDAKTRKFLSYANIAVTFALIGISLGKAGL